MPKALCARRANCHEVQGMSSMEGRANTTAASGWVVPMMLLIAMVAVAAVLVLSPPSHAQTEPPADGDWVVSDSTTIVGVDFILNGSVIVEPTGRLTLVDVVLRLNCSYPGEFNVTVEPGGELYMSDLDHDPATTTDATVVTSSRGAHYLWFSRAGSKLRISASVVQDCGITVAYRRGMMVETSDAVIEDSTFTHCNYGVYVLSSSPVIEDCVLEANDGYGLYAYQGSARVERCTFRDNFDAGAWLVAVQGMVLRDCTFADHEWAGLNASASNLAVENCTFRNNTWYGARFYLNCRGSLANCTVTGGSYCGIYLGEGSNLTVRGCTVSAVAGRGLWAYKSGATVDACACEGCDEGMFVYASPLDITNCSIARSRTNGVTVSDTTAFRLTGCSVEDSGNNGVFVGSLWTGRSSGDIQACDIVRNRRAGVFIQDRSTSDIDNTSFEGNGIYGVYCDGSGEVRWTEPHNRTIRDQTFRVLGYLRVDGNLTLVNCTLAFNRTAVVSSYVWVLGTLGLLDTDGDRYTSLDSTVLESIAPPFGARPIVLVRAGSPTDPGTVRARNSLFIGVAIKAEEHGELMATGCEFQEVATAITLMTKYSAVLSTVKDCVFAGIVTGIELNTPATVTGCSFSRCDVGAYLHYCLGVTVFNSSFISCDVGIRTAVDVGTSLEQLRFLDCNTSVDVVGSDDLRMDDLQVRSSRRDGMHLLNARASLSSSAIQGSGGSGVMADHSRLQLTECDLTDNVVAALTSNSSYVELLGCSLTSAESTAVWASFGRVQVNDSYVNPGTGVAALAREGAEVVFRNTAVTTELACTDTALIEVWWEFRIRMVIAGDRVPPEPVAVEVRTQGGAVALDTDSDEDGLTPWTWARQVQVRAAGATAFSPYSVEAVLMGRAFSSSFDLRSKMIHTFDIPAFVVAKATHSEPIVEGAEALFDGSSSDGFPYDVVSYEWDLDYGQTFTPDASGARVTVTFPANGELSVALRVNTTEGDTDILVLVVTVEDTGPVIVPVAAWPASADEDEELALDIRYESPVDEVILIEWDFGDGERAQGASVVHAWERTGAYLVRLSVLDEDGSTATAEFPVAVNNVEPVAAVASPIHARKGVSAMLDGSASHDTPSDNGTLLHVWDLGGGKRLLGAIVYHAFDRAGEYPVTLTVSDGDGAASTVTAMVVVSNEPPRFGALPDVTLKASGGEQRVPLGGLLSDPDDDVANLTVSAEVPEDGPLRGVRAVYDPLTGWSLLVTMEGYKDGGSSIQVTVEDVDGGRATAGINVTVEGGSTVGLPDAWWPFVLLVAAAVVALVVVVLVRARRKGPA